MKTKIIIHRLHSEAYSEFSKAAKENITKDRFRMYPTQLTFDCEGVKYIYTSWEDWQEVALPKGEDVDVILECLITEEERLELSRHWHVR